MRDAAGTTSPRARKPQRNGTRHGERRRAGGMPRPGLTLGWGRSAPRREAGPPQALPGAWRTAPRLTRPGRAQLHHLDDLLVAVQVQRPRALPGLHADPTHPAAAAAASAARPAPAGPRPPQPTTARACARIPPFPPAARAGPALRGAPWEM